MPFAFGHLIGAWIIGKIYEHFSKKKITNYGWFFLLLGGIFPDIDFLLDWTLGAGIHRTFTHSWLFLIIVPLFVYIIFKSQKDKQAKYFSLALVAGILIHLLLDFFSLQGIPLFWPHLAYYSPLGLTNYNTELALFSVYTLKTKIKFAILDMGLGTTWILYLSFKKRIKF
ncbi:MAG: metal-dependent hydrolase [Nanoarchaeota archaeon]|nr:metal-dependent hydrolase [Nanoarchaeota archaeon]MBU1622389.1 metal-dependent hydrolase [Nanoarchaeota archaeon]